MPIRLYAFLHPPSCKKCLSSDIQTAYCAEAACDGHAVGGEHLHRTCETCGYAWLEECARLAYRVIPEAAPDGRPPSTSQMRARSEVAATGEEPEVAGDRTEGPPEPRRRRERSERTVPDEAFIAMKDRLDAILHVMSPFEGTTRELVARIQEEFPELDWLRDPRRVGPFAKTLETRRAPLLESGIALSIERSGDGPNRIRLAPVGGRNGGSGSGTDERPGEESMEAPRTEDQSGEG